MAGPSRVHFPAVTLDRTQHRHQPLQPPANLILLVCQALWLDITGFF